MTLKSLNLAAGLLHATLLVGVSSWLLLKYKPNNNNGLTTDLYHITKKDQEVVTKEVTETKPFAVVGLIVTFLIVTILAHFLYFALTKWYEGMIRNENNYARFMEYALSATCMIAIIAFTVGEKSFTTLILLCVVNAMVMLLGNIVERSLRTDRTTSVMATAIAWVLFLTAWSSLTYTFLQQNNVPSFVPAVFVTMVVLFSCFGIVQLVQLISPSIPYWKIETSYVVLSFVAKTILVLLVTSGLVARSG
jgi:hypothetical protein